MMKVSRKSWHYRLTRYLGGVWTVFFEDNPWAAFKFVFKPGYTTYQPKPRSLCLYFWRVVGLMLLFPAFWVSVLLASVVTALVLIGYGVMYPAIWFVRRQKEKNRAARRALEKRYLNGEISWDEWQGIRRREKKEGLFVAFLKAKKQKVCPLIELED